MHQPSGWIEIDMLVEVKWALFARHVRHIKKMMHRYTGLSMYFKDTKKIKRELAKDDEPTKKGTVADKYKDEVDSESED